MAVSKLEVVRLRLHSSYMRDSNMHLEALGLAQSSGIYVDRIPHRPIAVK